MWRLKSVEWGVGWKHQSEMISSGLEGYRQKKKTKKQTMSSLRGKKIDNISSLT